MTRPTPAAAPRGLNLTDPGTLTRLDATGIPGDVALLLSGLNVSVGLVERLHACGLSWEFVRTLSHTRGLRAAKDVAALVTLTTSGLEPEEIRQWALLGNLDAALRLHLKNVPIGLVRSFPLTTEHGAKSVLKMLQAIPDTGIHVEDVLLWHTAGVLTLSPPYLITEVWVPWRAAAVNHLGLRPAALAAAAGLSVTEAVEQWHTGAFNAAALRMMAALRSGTP